MRIYMHKPTLAQLMAQIDLGEPKAVVIDGEFNGYPADVRFSADTLASCIVASIDLPERDDPYYVKAILIVYEGMELLAMINDLHWNAGSAGQTIDVRLLS